jgi:hypothetical protein
MLPALIFITVGFLTPVFSGSDCVYENCGTALIDCFDDSVCSAVIYAIEEENLCDNDANGGNLCFDHDHQQELCAEFADKFSVAASEHDCEVTFAELAKCYQENNCQEKEDEDDDDDDVDDADYYYYYYYNDVDNGNGNGNNGYYDYYGHYYEPGYGYVVVIYGDYAYSPEYGYYGDISSSYDYDYDYYDNPYDYYEYESGYDYYDYASSETETDGESQSETSYFDYISDGDYYYSDSDNNYDNSDSGSAPSPEESQRRRLRGIVTQQTQKKQNRNQKKFRKFGKRQRGKSHQKSVMRIKRQVQKSRNYYSQQRIAVAAGVHPGKRPHIRRRMKITNSLKKGLLVHGKRVLRTLKAHHQQMKTNMRRKRRK